MGYNVLELARMHVDALYVHDSMGRMLRVNEPNPDEPAPRFFLVRTVEGNLWRTRHDLPAGLAAELEQAASDEPVASDLSEPPHYVEKYAALLEQYAPVEKTYAGPAYQLPELDPPGNTVTISPQNAGLLKAYFPYTLWNLAERAPVVVVTADGAAVAVCYSARRTARVAEAGVYTYEFYRRRGYAGQAVRGWAGAVRATGRLPLYSTWWENKASQAVAAKLGAVLYAVELGIT